MDAAGQQTSRPEITAALRARTFLTFAGTETYLLLQQGHPLREFCAFEVARDDDAWERMERSLLRPIADAAATHGFGLLTDCLVWRASSDYVARLGHQDLGVAGVNRLAVDRTRRFVEGWRATSTAAAACPVILAADLGPRGDGYAVAEGGPITVEAAHDYHAPQVDALAEAGIDLVVALTMTSTPEAVGVVRAAERAGLPILVSPTLETDGELPDGSSLERFIAAVDDATAGAPVGYMANCVHPRHLAPVLRAAADHGAAWLDRFRGLRANASTKTHAELDESTSIDRGDPADLAREVADLRYRHGLTIVGGCCGTDADHLTQLAAACR